MDESESLGMQSLTRKKLEAVFNELTVLCIDGSLSDFRSIVTLIIEERMTYPVEMHADLVRTSCLKTALHYGHISETLKNSVMRYSMLSVITFREDLESHTVIRVTADVSDDGALIILQISPDNCYITAFDRVDKELLGKI